MAEKRNRNSLTQAELMAKFTYEPETGIFRHRPSNRQAKAGSIAGRRTHYGYTDISVFGIRYLAHRLAWLYVYGCWPKEIDHINRVRDDNRITNLRDVSHAANIFNQAPRSDNTSGYRRVSYFKLTGRWVAHITVKGRSKYLGYYDTPEEAHAAYLRARADLLGADDVPALGA